MKTLEDKALETIYRKCLTIPEFTSDLMKGIGKIIIPVTINEEIIKEVEKES